jgi:hypothetical protein
VFPATFNTSCNLFGIAISVQPEDRFVIMSDVYPSFCNSSVEHKRFCTACTSLRGQDEAQAAQFGPDRSIINTLHVQLPGSHF